MHIQSNKKSARWTIEKKPAATPGAQKNQQFQWLSQKAYLELKMSSNESDRIDPVSEIFEGAQIAHIFSQRSPNSWVLNQK